MWSNTLFNFNYWVYRCVETRRLEKVNYSIQGGVMRYRFLIHTEFGYFRCSLITVLVQQSVPATILLSVCGRAAQLNFIYSCLHPFP